MSWLYLMIAIVAEVVAGVVVLNLFSKAGGH